MFCVCLLSVLVALVSQCTCTTRVVPLVIWPGMGDSCCYVFGADGYRGIIESMIPGIYVKLVTFGKTPQEDTYNSFFLNANTQIELACQLLSTDPQLKDGFNAMGFSQGSQFLRALVQRCPTVKVYNLISVGGQHQGVYGFPFCIAKGSLFCDLFRQFLSIGIYLLFIQESIVQAEYWHDPHNEESYKLDCLFLPDINQEITFNSVYKERLSNISNFLLIKFEQDRMVQPIETQWFGFYKPGQAIETYSLFESRIYKDDLLGLRYLNNTGRLHLLSSPNGHTLLTYNWLQKYIMPYINITYSDAHLPVVVNSREQHQRYVSISSVESYRKVITSVDRPFSIDMSLDGNVFVCGYSDKTIYQFDLEGNLVRQFDPLPDGQGPCSISVYKSELFIANNGSSIYKYSIETGRYKGMAYNTSLLLYGVIVDDDGLMYITQYDDKGHIHVVNQDGVKVGILTAAGRHPRKIQFDSDDNIRVTDSVSGSVYVISKENHLLHEYLTNVSSPDGFFIDSDDNMVISDRKSGIYVYDKGGKFVHQITGFKGCSDVQVSVNDVLWITDVEDNKIYLF